MAQYEKSFEVEQIAKDIIENLKLDENIKKAKIAYLFSLQKTSTLMGQIQKQGKAWKLLSEYDFIVIMHKETWKGLKDNQKKALTYHELLHISHKEKEDKETGEVETEWRLRKHDIEEFLEVVREFGDWSEELEALHNIREKEE